jgi:hypothetical protein
VSFQAVVYFTPVLPMQLRGSYRLGSVPAHTILTFASPQERKECVESPAVWWYQLVEDLDFGGEGGAIGQRASWANPAPDTEGAWRKGGAWEAAGIEAAHEAEGLEADERGW